MKALTDRYTAVFLEDLAHLGILPPTYTPKATEYIPDMIRLIQALETRGLAYTRDGSVYYRIAGLPQYGRLARLDRDGMKPGASVDADEYERDSMQDFVLWKAAKPGEPWWDSPWGPGRPGWHIECSAMGIALLGERMDIHSGGVDLVFPHHENEIAQSEGCLGHTWVNTWVHGEFLLVDGEKMSKSLGNFYTLRDLQAKGYDPRAFRFTIQSNHYRKVLNFSFDGLRAAEQALKRIRLFRKRMEEDGAGRPGRMEGRHRAPGPGPGGPGGLLGRPGRRPEHPRGPGRPVHPHHRPQRPGRPDRPHPGRAGRRPWPSWTRPTPSSPAGPTRRWRPTPRWKALIERRKAAKAARDWAEADRVRDRLKAMGIVLEDRKDGSVTWRRG